VEDAEASAAPGKPVYNRTVTLRDRWEKAKGKGWLWGGGFALRLTLSRSTAAMGRTANSLRHAILTLSSLLLGACAEATTPGSVSASIQSVRVVEAPLSPFGVIWEVRVQVDGPETDPVSILPCSLGLERFADNAWSSVWVQLCSMESRDQSVVPPLGSGTVSLGVPAQAAAGRYRLVLSLRQGRGGLHAVRPEFVWP